MSDFENRGLTRRDGASALLLYIMLFAVTCLQMYIMVSGFLQSRLAYDLCQYSTGAVQAAPILAHAVVNLSYSLLV